MFAALHLVITIQRNQPKTRKHKWVNQTNRLTTNNLLFFKTERQDNKGGGANQVPWQQTRVTMVIISVTQRAQRLNRRSAKETTESKIKQNNNVVFKTLSHKMTEKMYIGPFSVD